MDRAGPVIAPDAVERIAVFRALVLGDLLCATPALRALRAAYPHAQITLVGLPWAEALVRRLPALDRLLPFPGFPGLREQAPDLTALPGFLAAAQAARFDLAVQLHGDGRITNPLVACFGARHHAGFHRADGPTADAPLSLPWPEHGHEVDRCLALTDHLGLPRQGRALDFPLEPADRARLKALWPALDERPYVVLHPGAQLRSRRWPVERFARVADALSDAGWRVVVTGTADERPLAQALLQACGCQPVDLVGATDLWTLGALLQGARLLLSNDTGVSHIAAALRTPSVVVALGGEVARWAPADRQRHRILWHDLPCRPCGHAHCPTAHECATAIDADAVIDAALALLQPQPHLGTPPCRPPLAACASSPGMCMATTSTT
jgi:ADP-heptose:LPS heptosyltransferase